MRRLAATVLFVFLASPGGLGWDAHGHRTITYLALDAFPPGAPAWLRDAATRHRIAFQANQADRWKGWRSSPLNHTNRPDHFLDEEYLSQFDLTLETLPRLRREYVRALAVSKHVHPQQVDPYDVARDPDRIREWPGFVLHAIDEHFARLQASFNDVRILEKLNDPARAKQLEQARANAIYHMGLLSHFVADTAQPLHTTKHYNGWSGDNPNGYTTSRSIHSFIDGGAARLHGLTYATLRPHVKFNIKINAADPWKDILAHFRRSFEQVEPLYALERDGQLREAAGRKFIVERMADGAAMLGALYTAAYESAAPTDAQVAAFVRYNNFEPEKLPEFKPPTAKPGDSGGK
jgi:hypothetical protein